DLAVAGDEAAGVLDLDCGGVLEEAIRTGCDDAVGDGEHVGAGSGDQVAGGVIATVATGAEETRPCVIIDRRSMLERKAKAARKEELVPGRGRDNAVAGQAVFLLEVDYRRPRVLTEQAVGHQTR